MGINKKDFKGIKKEFIFVFHNISKVMNLRTWNRIYHIVLTLVSVLFYLVNGSNVSANIDASILMIPIFDIYQ